MIQHSNRNGIGSLYVIMGGLVVGAIIGTYIDYRSHFYNHGSRAALEQTASVTLPDPR
jgi:hypothetical protein